MKWSPLCWLALAGVVTSTAALLHSAVLDRDGDVVVSWTPDEATNSIVIRVEARTRGWAAIGFSPAGGMTGADIVMAWVTDGHTHIQDMHAVADAMPLLDDSEDVKLLEGSENDTHTVFTFSRQLRSCDTRHDLDIGMDTTRLIWAMHPSDPAPGRGPSYHAASRGTRSVSLDGSAAFQFPADDQTESFFLGNADTEIAESSTHYHCTVHKLPDFGQKVHYTGYRVQLSPDTAPYVHHLVLYGCSVPPGMESYFEDYAKNHPGAKCYSQNMPPNWSFCKSTVIAWAIGSEGDMLPDNVGMSLEAENGGATYFMLESHYDNPQRHSGKKDSSGLKIFFTRSLRPVEAGIIATGHAVSSTQLIPPRQHRYTTGSVCYPHCTQKHFPAAGVQVHSVMLHAHLAGRSVILRHIREGQELAPIAVDRYYDFNYQQSRKVDAAVRILPGDILLTECGYSTEDRTNVTMGGFGTYSEMCLAFVTYFPRTALSACGSVPHIGDILQTMGVDTVRVNGTQMPVVKGGHVWTMGGFRRSLSNVNRILDGAPVKKAKKKETKLSRDDWFNRAQLSTMSVSVDGEPPSTTLYEYLMGESWSQPTIDSLQRQANGGRQYQRCMPANHNDWKDFDSVYSGPHQYPQFQPWEPEKTPGCEGAMRGDANRHSPLGGALAALVVTALHVLF